jgi:RNA polymerase sigma factor (sigma-70 family)
MVSTILSYQSRPADKRIRLSAEDITHLVGAASAGDERAWNALVGEFSSMIWAVARAYRLRDADASEVSQATWLRLLEHLGKLTDPARLGAWLATTARRECLRVLRENERCALYGDDAPEQVSPEMSPDDVALLGERAEALWRSFSRLRATDQALLRLLMADPRPPYDAIAAALDMPIGSIGPTRQRALERLRNELRRQGTLGLLID